MEKKVVFTGGNGRFAEAIKKIQNSYKIFYPNKKELNILSEKNIENYLRKIRPKILVHMAGLSRPMKQHEDNIHRSIDLNIVGTANIVKVCSRMNIKVIYLSSGYVYQGKKGDYKETDAILPWNNYGWSKLGGEASVQMYRNSLIIRANISQSPFLHNRAFSNVKINFLYHDEAAKIIFKLINKKGIINLGGESNSIYKFAKKTNPKVKKLSLKNNKYPKKLTMNLKKLNKLLKV
tara:strand:+ start:246 stop:950 length:705 start_codon:yes stop_codon:yes gene_type:complete